jgi:hypothetical protein
MMRMSALLEELRHLCDFYISFSAVIIFMSLLRRRDGNEFCCFMPFSIMFLLKSNFNLPCLPQYSEDKLFISRLKKRVAHALILIKKLILDFFKQVQPYSFIF